MLLALSAAQATVSCTPYPKGGVSGAIITSSHLSRWAQQVACPRVYDLSHLGSASRGWIFLSLRPSYNWNEDWQLFADVYRIVPRTIHSAGLDNLQLTGLGDWECNLLEGVPSAAIGDSYGAPQEMPLPQWCCLRVAMLQLTAQRPCDVFRRAVSWYYWLDKALETCNAPKA